MARNIELYPALPISSTSIQRNHEHGNTDTAKSDLSRNELFGVTEYWIPSGGVTLGGDAAISRGVTIFASGGISLSGEANTSKSRTYTATVSGGTTLGGEATVARTYSPAVSGGTVLAGAASTSFLSAGGTEYQYTGAGEIGLAGAAQALQVRLPTGGEVVFGPVFSYYVAPLIVLDQPKPEPKPQPKTWVVSGTWLVGLGGQAQCSMRSEWAASVSALRFAVGGSAAVSRSFAIPTGVNQLAEKRKRQIQEEALLLAL